MAQPGKKPELQGGAPERWIRTATIALLALAVVLRLALVIAHGMSPSRVCTADSAAYLDLAQGLVTRHSFGRSVPLQAASAENPSPVEVFRTPGYPLLLAVPMWLGLPVIPCAILLQIILDAIAVALSFQVATLLLPRRWAVVAGLLQVVDVGRVVYSNMIMSDVPFTFLVALLLWLLSARGPALSPRRGLLAGLVVSMATAVRPMGGALLVPAVLALLLRRVRLAHLATFLSAAMLFPLAWTIRNAAVAGQWTLSSAFDYNLCQVAAAKVKAHVEGVNRASAQEELLARVLQASPTGDMSQRSAAFRRLGLDTFAGNPGATIREALVSTVEITIGGERRHLLRLLGRPEGEAEVASLGEESRAPGGLLRGLAHRPLSEIVLVAVSSDLECRPAGLLRPGILVPRAGATPCRGRPARARRRGFAGGFRRRRQRPYATACHSGLGDCRQPSAPVRRPEA